MKPHKLNESLYEQSRLESPDEATDQLLEATRQAALKLLSHHGLDDTKEMPALTPDVLAFQSEFAQRAQKLLDGRKVLDIAEATRISSKLLDKFFKGLRLMSRQKMQQVLDYCGATPDERAYFENLTEAA